MKYSYNNDDCIPTALRQNIITHFFLKSDFIAGIDRYDHSAQCVKISYNRSIRSLLKI